MEHVAEWDAHVFLFEHDNETAARVVLETGSAELHGEGRARRNPSDPLVPEIGDELAVGRALVDLGTKLIDAASDDIAHLGRKRVPQGDADAIH